MINANQLHIGDIVKPVLSEVRILHNTSSSYQSLIDKKLHIASACLTNVFSQVVFKTNKLLNSTFLVIGKNKVILYNNNIPPVYAQGHIFPIALNKNEVPLKIEDRLLDLRKITQYSSQIHLYDILGTTEYSHMYNYLNDNLNNNNKFNFLYSLNGTNTDILEFFAKHILQKKEACISKEISDFFSITLNMPHLIRLKCAHIHNPPHTEPIYAVKSFFNVKKHLFTKFAAINLIDKKYEELVANLVYEYFVNGINEILMPPCICAVCGKMFRAIAPFYEHNTLVLLPEA